MHKPGARRLVLPVAIQAGHRQAEDGVGCKHLMV
jgi:hypothetical protein